MSLCIHKESEDDLHSRKSSIQWRLKQMHIAGEDSLCWEMPKLAAEGIQGSH